MYERYVEFVSDNTGTLLPRLFGLYSAEYAGRKVICFLLPLVLSRLRLQGRSITLLSVAIPWVRLRGWMVSGRLKVPNMSVPSLYMLML